MFSALTRIGLLGTLGVGSAVAFLGGDRVKLYYESGKEAIVSAIDEAQGMDAKLRLIKTQINSLDDEERRLKRDAIENTVELEGLRRDIAAREDSIEKQAALLDRVSKLLADGSSQYAIAGRTYDRAVVERDATEKLAVYTVQKDTLQNLKDTLATKEKAQEMASANVSRAAALRSELKGQVALLEAQLEKLRAKQNFVATVDQVVDTDQIDSSLARAKEMIHDFSKKLEVKDRLLDEQLKGANSQPSLGISYDATTASANDVAAQIRVKLSERSSKGDVAKADPAHGVSSVDITVH